MSPDPSDTRNTYQVICDMRREADFDVGWARVFFCSKQWNLAGQSKQKDSLCKRNKTEFPESEKETLVTRTTFIKRRKLKGGDRRTDVTRRYTDMHPGRVKLENRLT